MRAPLTKSLRAAFPDLTAKDANLIRKLAHTADNRDALETLVEARCPDTAAYARSCYHSPWTSPMWRRTMVLHAIDRLLGTYGVESIGDTFATTPPAYEYCNAGDTYAVTLIYRRKSDNLFIGNWGDIVEKENL